MSDPVRLKQVLVNLLDNAIKYTPAGGMVTVSWRKASHTGFLSIEDTGQGIASEELLHVYERFYRTDKARSRTSGGAGLGLSIVKAISTAIQSNVTITSKVSQGTTSTVEIPLWNQTSATNDGLPVPVTGIGNGEQHRSRIEFKEFV
jgi:signal transduction histidine kinase